MKKGKQTVKTAVKKDSSKISKAELAQIKESIATLSALSADAQVEQIPEVLKAIQSVPTKEVGAILEDAAREHQATVLPLLEAMAADPELAESAIEAMGLVRSETTVAILQGFDTTEQPKALAKAARRSLYRLKSQGIEVPEVIGPSLSLGGGPKISKALTAPVEGNGSQYFAFYASMPMIGQEIVQVIVHGEIGIEDTRLQQMKFSDYDRDIEALKTNEGMVVVEAPLEYALFKIREAEKLSKSLGNPIPEAFSAHDDMFHVPSRDYEKPAIYETIDAETVTSDPTLVEKGAELFATGLFSDWYVPAEILEPFGENVEKAAKGVFTPEILAIYKTRMEENAYIAHLNGQDDIAKMSLACGLQLVKDGLKPAQSPFVVELVNRSIKAAKEKPEESE